MTAPTRGDTVDPELREKLGALLVALLVASALLLFRLPRLVVVPGAFNDDGVYLALGKALATGQGYRSIHLVGAPLHVKFPPGLPAVLAILWSLFDELADVAAAASTLSVAVTSAAAGLVWWIGRSRLGLPAPLLAVLAIGPFLLDSAIEYYSLPITEPWYALGWAVALLLAYRLLERPRDDDPGRAAVLGLALAATALFRTQVAPLVPAFALALLVARRPRQAAVMLVAALLPLAAWSVVVHRMKAGLPLSSMPDEGGYLGFYRVGDPAALVRALASTVASNCYRYGLGFGTYASAVAPLGVAIVVTFAALVVVGAWRLGRAHAALSLGVAATVALLLAWPSPQDRLLIPVLPFAGLLAASALAPAWRAPQRALRVGAIALTAALGLLVTARQFTARREMLRLLMAGEAPAIRPPSWFLPLNSREIVLASSWIGANTPPDARVLFSFPSGLWLHTGRQAETSDPTESAVTRSVWSTPGDFLARRIVEDRVDVVVLEGPATMLARDVATVEGACPDALSLAGRAKRGWPAFYRVGDAGCVARAFGVAPR